MATKKATKNWSLEQIYLACQKAFAKANCFVDLFFAHVCSLYPRVVEYLLRIILGKVDLVVQEVKVQYHITSLANRSIYLDVLAKDSTGKLYNIEVQQANKGATAKRSRFHVSAIDSSHLQKGTKFEDLPEVYVIFICLEDIFHAGKSIYRIERVVLETNKLFNDAAHIIFASGAWRGNDPLGILMHDFSCTDIDEMKDMEFKEMIAYCKTTEGVKNMSPEILELMDDFIQEVEAKGVILGKDIGFAEGLAEGEAKGRAEGKAEGLAEGEAKGRAEGKAEGLAEAISIVAKNLLRNGHDLESIANITGLTLEEVKNLKTQL